MSAVRKATKVEYMWFINSETYAFKSNRATPKMNRIKLEK